MKITPRLTPLAVCLALAFTACDRKPVVIVEVPASEPVAKTRTFETSRLKSAIDSYEKAPTKVGTADVRKAFAELDSEIAELEVLVAKRTGDERAEAAQKLANLSAYRSQENARFAKAQAASAIDVPADARSGVQKAEDAARNTGDAVKNAAKEAGDVIKDAGKKAGDAIKDVTR